MSSTNKLVLPTMSAINVCFYVCQANSDITFQLYLMSSKALTCYPKIAFWLASIRVLCAYNSTYSATAMYILHEAFKHAVEPHIADLFEVYNKQVYHKVY